MSSLVVQWCNELAEGSSGKQPAVEDEAYFLRVCTFSKLLRAPLHTHPVLRNDMKPCSSDPIACLEGC